MFEAFHVLCLVDDVTRDVDSCGLVSCVDAGDCDVLVGTSGGHLARYQYCTSDVTTDDVTTVSCSLLGSVQLGQSAVTSVHLLSASERVLVLCAQCLSVLHASSLAVIDPASVLAADNPSSSAVARLRGVSVLAVNDNPPSHVDPFTVQVCVVTRGSHVALWHVHAAGMTPVAAACGSIWTAGGECVCGVCFSGVTLCVVTERQYWVVNLTSAHRQHLFDFDPAVQRPLVASFSQGEFVLLGAGNLALFASSTSGSSVRPPVQLTHSPLAWTFQPPYLISVDRASLAYVSVEDGGAGSMGMPGASDINISAAGTLLITANSSVFLLRPVSLDCQLETLVNCGSAVSALTVYDRYECTGRQPSSLVTARLALLLLCQGHDLDRSLTLLRASAHVSLTQMLSLVCDDTWGVDISWREHRHSMLSLIPQLHTIDNNVLDNFVADFVQAAGQEADLSESVIEAVVLLLLRCERIEAVHQFLAVALPHRPLPTPTGGSHDDVTTVSDDVTTCRLPVLARHPLQRARLLNTASPADNDAALLVCEQVLTQSPPSDTQQEAALLMSDILLQVVDSELFGRYVAVLLVADIHQAGVLFTSLALRQHEHQLHIQRGDEPITPAPISPADVVHLLQSHPVTLIVYANRLLECLSRDVPEDVCTALANVYLDRIEQQSSTSYSMPDRLDNSCHSQLHDSTLSQLLQLVADHTRQLCHVPQLLERAISLRLSLVAAHLYVRMAEFEKAVQVMITSGHTSSSTSVTPLSHTITRNAVRQAVDFIEQVAPSGGQFAVNNCTARRRMFNSLLTECLRNAHIDGTCALYLLNTCAGVQRELDACGVWRRLDDGWAVTAVSPWLLAVRQMLHRRLSVSRQLSASAAASLLAVRVSQAASSSACVLVETGSRCGVCGELLSSCEVMMCPSKHSPRRYLNLLDFDTSAANINDMLLVHPHCALPPPGVQPHMSLT